MKNKKMNFWILISILVIAMIALFVIYNWEAFASGFEAGSKFAE